MTLTFTFSYATMATGPLRTYSTRAEVVINEKQDLGYSSYVIFPWPAFEQTLATSANTARMWHHISPVWHWEAKGNGLNKAVITIC